MICETAPLVFIRLTCPERVYITYVACCTNILILQKINKKLVPGITILFGNYLFFFFCDQEFYIWNIIGFEWSIDIYESIIWHLKYNIINWIYWIFSNIPHYISINHLYQNLQIFIHHNIFFCIHTSKTIGLSTVKKYY